MWSDPTGAWKVWSPDFLGDEIDPERASSPWAGHRDFVYDLIRWRQPEMTVELGSEYGCSLFAIFQALSDSNSKATLHGIDTWQGSPDSYEKEAGPAIQRTFSASLAELDHRFPEGSVAIQVHQCTFAEALDDFEDESIDLLHIDGCHEFEALKEDFETWLPKVARNGMVLLHDVAPDSGLGSSQYFAREISNTHPNFSFGHNFGLAIVLPKGTEAWDYLFSDEFTRWREAYRFEAEARFGRVVERDLTSLVEERGEAIAKQTQLIDERNRLIDEQDRIVEKLNWQIGSMEELLGILPQQLDEANARVHQLENSPKAQVRALVHAVPRSIDRRLRIRAAIHRVKHVLRPRTRLREFRKKRQQKQLGRAGDDGSPGNPGGFEEIPKSLTLGALLERVAREHPDVTREQLLQTLTEGGDPSALIEGEPGSSETKSAHSASRKTPGLTQRIFRLHGNGSERTGELIDLIERSQPDLISVDVWNTLIGRNRPADAAKTATGRRICLLAQKMPGVKGMDPFDVASLRREVEAELAAEDPVEEYELVAVLTELLLRLGHPGDESLNDLAIALAEAEVRDEVEWSHTLEDVHALVQSTSTETVLLSDFYMAREHLGTIVREVTGLDVEVMVSADTGASKRVEGGLFERIRAEREVPAERHLHVGDHPQADIENQTESGGLAVFVPAPDDFPPPGSFSREDLSSCWRVLDQELDALASVEADPFRQAGIELSPLATLLVSRAIEEAQVSGVDRIHYLSREGSFLAQVHEVVEPILRPPGAAAIQAVHLPLSRRSTFAASLEEPFLDSLQRMWTMYPKQTVEAMLVSIALEPGECTRYLERVGLSPDDELEHAPSDPRIQDLFQDREFTQMLRDHVTFQRAALREFVGQLTDTDETPFLTVDIGWRGTIQDNLVRALGISPSTGFYLGLFPFLNPQPDGCHKEGVAFDANQGDEFAFADPPGPVERAWTPNVPSMIGFDRSNSNASAGSFEPVWQGESGAISPGIADFQSGTVAAAPVVAKWLTGMGFTGDLVKDGLFVRARKAWLTPPPGLADIWFGSDHDDTFGGLSQLTYEKLLPDESWLEEGLREALEVGERVSGWPPGYRQWSPVRGITELQRAAAN